MNAIVNNMKHLAGSRRHLFIINPAAKRIKGKVQPLKDAIDAFFARHTWINYDIYVSQWCRDSIMYIQQYLAGKSNEIIRIHAIGGTGALFEVINGVVGLPNVEVASHPYGIANTFLKYFGAKNENLFLSIASQVFDAAIPLDIVRCGNNYGICYGMVGLEARANVVGEKMIVRRVPGDLSYMLGGASLILGGTINQKYYMEIDGEKIEGDFISVLIANSPCYGVKMYPAIEAHPDDGILDIYVIKNAPPLKLLRWVPGYTHGQYHRIPHLISHYRGKKIKLTSDEVMFLSIDAEHFYGSSIEYEVVPHAIRFVCPAEIDVMKLPRIYNRPREGLRCEQ